MRWDRRKYSHDRDLAGVVLGTAGYMSRAGSGQAGRHRSDIFSFGAILYELLSGKRAFQGDSAWRR